MALHVAITRRARPGCESEFEEAVRQFLGESFSHPAVRGANLILPAPGSGSREFGILRTFRDEKERAEFYQSPLFLAWQDRARLLTEGETEYRQLHGLEAWFRAGRETPPRWKMALVTFAGVLPLTSFLPLVITPILQPLQLPPFFINLAVTGAIVLLLTWLIMPGLTRFFNSWLHSK